MPTLKDVAILAGVSTATVSRTLSGAYYVTDETKRKVLEAVATLNYQPNGIARSLRNAKTQTIGVLVPDISNPYFMQIVSALEDYLSASEYNLLIASSGESATKEDALLRVFLEKRVDGLVLAPSRTELGKALDGYLNQAIPVVLVDRSIQDVPVDTVVEESENSTYDLVQYVISMGHSKIAIINGRSVLSTVVERERGYMRALKDAGIPIQMEYILQGDYSQPSGYSLGKRLLNMGSDRPTAVFCTNNSIALGVMIACHELKCQIPKDLSVVSFGDLLLPAFVTPRITAILQNPKTVGSTAARILLDRLSTEWSSGIEEILLPTHVRLGESVSRMLVNSNLNIT